MTTNILDRLTDDFPHGTIDGDRAGCTGVGCPAEPYSCSDIARLYRTDFRFQRLYKTGIRGSDLQAAYDLKEVPGLPAEVASVADALPEIMPLADRTWEGLTDAGRDVTVLKWKDEGFTATEIAERIGLSPIGTGRLIAAARRRIEEALSSGGSVPVVFEPPQPRERPSTVETPAPLEAAELFGESGALPVAIADIPGPQIAEMWVVLDREKHIVLASTDLDAALTGLAGEWRKLLGSDPTS